MANELHNRIRWYSKCILGRDTIADATERLGRLLQTGHRALEWKNFYSVIVSISRKLCHPLSELSYTDGCPSI